MSTTNEISVEEKNHIANEERIGEIRVNLERMGLVEFLPEFVKDKWNYPDKFVICDPAGKAIVCRHEWPHHVADVFSDMLNRETGIMSLEVEDNQVYVYTTIESITIPERHSLATLNQYFSEYRPGLRSKDDNVNLPYALHALAAPINFLNEADAHDLAAAIQAVYPSCDVDVTTTDEGFAVVVSDGSIDLNGADSERITAIAEVVEHFTLIPKRRPAFEIDDTITSSSAPWQLAVTERHTQQKRIEAKVDRILSRLDDTLTAGVAVKNRTTPKPGSAVDVFADQDAHRLPAKPGRKARAGK